MALGTSSGLGASTCSVCGEGEARYRCPRCRCEYCCVGCYRRHAGGKCRRELDSDAEKQVKYYVGKGVVDDAERKEFAERLKRFWEDGLDEDWRDLWAGKDAQDDTERLEEAAARLEEGDLEGAFTALSADQRVTFESMVRDGRLRVAQWEPWWEHRVTEDWRSGARLAPAPIQAAVRKASELVAFSVVEVACAFCNVARLYNGDWATPAALEDLLVKSHVLSRDERFQNASVAVREGFSRHGSLLAIDDASTVLADRRQAIRMFGELADALVKHGRRRALKMAAKKSEFLLFWVEGATQVRLSLLSSQVAAEMREIETLIGKSPASSRNPGRAARTG